MDLFLAFLLGAAIASVVLILQNSKTKSEAASLRVQIDQQKLLVAQIKEHDEQLRREADQRWQARLDALTAQLSQATADLADKGLRSLQESNTRQWRISS